MVPGRQFAIRGAKAVLGRHPDCEIVVDVGAVSRQHAQVLVVGGEFFLEDLGSRNGTYVNGQAIKGRQRLEEDDRIKICDVLFTFHLTAPGAGSDGSSFIRRTELAMVVDDGDGLSGSTVMSTLDVKSSRSGARITGVTAESKLDALLEISRSLSSAIGLDQVLPKILNSLFAIFLQADRGFIVLEERDSGQLVPKAVKHRRVEVAETVRISRTIVNQAMGSKQAILSADAATDSRFDTSQSIADFRIRSMMCVPLMDSAGVALGVIQIDTLDQQAPFQQADLDLLVSVASQAAFAVENAQLHEIALKKLALDRDLELAQSVQQSFLPASPPQATDYTFFDFYEPANQIGGDYFDYVHLPGDRLAVVLADVSGKGIPAALLMAKLSAETRFALAMETTAAGALNRLNAGFDGPVWEDRFVTYALCLIDMVRHELTIANAGHMAPFLRRADGRVELVGGAMSGVPLGVSTDYAYGELTVPLAPGDCLVLFTDGFSDAMNLNNEWYGVDRLEVQMLESVADVRELGQRVLDDVKRFVGKRPQSDDMCLLCFGRNRRSP